MDPFGTGYGPVASHEGLICQTVSLKGSAFWGVMASSLLEVNLRLRKTDRLHFQCQTVSLFLYTAVSNLSVSVSNECSESLGFDRLYV
jgi:hypothetical protein